MSDYRPHDWYWIIGGDDSRYWSSASVSYVTELPPDAGVTRIASEQELCDVLEAAGCGDRAPWSFEQRKARKLAEINAAYKAAMLPITSTYPSEERDSWAKQEKEARAYLADSNAPTPFIDYMLQERPVEGGKAELVNRIMAKVEAYEQDVGVHTGIRHRLEDQLETAQTEDDLALIVWPA